MALPINNPGMVLANWSKSFDSCRLYLKYSSKTVLEFVLKNTILDENPDGSIELRDDHTNNYVNLDLVEQAHLGLSYLIVRAEIDSCADSGAGSGSENCCKTPMIAYIIQTVSGFIGVNNNSIGANLDILFTNTFDNDLPFQFIHEIEGETSPRFGTNIQIDYTGSPDFVKKVKTYVHMKSGNIFYVEGTINMVSGSVDYHILTGFETKEYEKYVQKVFTCVDCETSTLGAPFDESGEYIINVEDGQFLRINRPRLERPPYDKIPLMIANYLEVYEL